MAKIQCMAEVVRAEELSDGIFSLWLCVPQIAEQAVPGQFISLYCKDHDRLLPRPISICEIDRKNGGIRIVYRVVGFGTTEFSAYHAGDTVSVLGPLGNGFPLQEAEKKNAVLIGGGIGIPPMLELAKQLDGHVTVVAGYRNADTFLCEELNEAADRLIVATEDGSVGVKGFVTDALTQENVGADVVYACGPAPMLRGIKEWGEKENIPVWVSMEERMACGIGACLACVCGSKEADGHSKVKNKRICKDGPVFLASEIEI